jgi:hypothetical protein
VLRVTIDLDQRVKIVREERKQEEMTRILSFCGVSALLALLCTAFAWAQCPEYPNDNGICDTLYVEVCPPDTLFSGFVRVPVYVTHDVLDPYEDSLAMLQIPFCYTHSNPSKYCSLSYHWNNLTTYPHPDSLLERSIFRHIIEEGDTVIHNWMMDQSQKMLGLAWAARFLELDETSHLRFYTRRTNYQEQHFGPGSRILPLTMTFRMQDTMTICLDTCFWPPENRLEFVTKWATRYIPRHSLPYCFSLTYPELGDVNADGAVNAGDIVFLLDYLFRDGPAPHPLEVGDVNCDEVITAGDVVFLIEYLFRGGPEPSC